MQAQPAGAGGRTRTGTVSLPVDFESTTSANSITPASGALIVYTIHSQNATLCRRLFSRRNTRIRRRPHYPLNTR